jgi:hypothetical protein
MTSWVYIFSKFTPEALLFEALIICLLLCVYTAFWVLKKRRYGSVETNLPSGPVKSYLNELISNAEHIRLQLFGLLSSPEYSRGSQSIFGGGPDPETVKKLAQLEIKLAEQSKSLELATEEKSRLEKELAGSGGSSGGAPLTGDAGLQKRVQELEGRLAEYSVIEDDLANLKRLQQENAQLKAQLAGKGETPATSQTSEAPVAAQALASDAASDPSTVQASSAPTEGEPEANASTETAAASTPAPEVTVEAASSESSPASNSVENATPSSPLDEATAALAATTTASPEAPAAVPPVETAPATEASPLSSSTPPANPEGLSNAEADLVAEFEKMLKS